ncbi:MAG: KAP family NTPase [Timaviella obliquedivisa GSE-PSE-MK23-08B]|nr:KAP family NTPase [Timaviella obliquedivisa GSE-PSE-MK23-08B]
MTQGNQINHHIEEYLDYYCGLSHAPGFAVLLKGQWGSGKTWFTNRYCERFQESEQEENEQRYFYISLYGVTTLSEIEDKFFQLLHPIRSSKGMAITGIILKGLLKGALKIDLTGDGRDDGTWNIQIPEINLPKHLENVNQSILIFDDLERCKIDLGSLLGYINYFVEHQELKVILIANEDELFKNINYQVIKEKLIGRTFGVSLDFEGALENFITRTNDSGVKTFLSDNTKLIKDLYDKAEYGNLRTLRQIILEFERIFKTLPDRAKRKIELLQDLLKLLIVFSIEIKQGTVYPKDISNLDKKYQSSEVSDRSSSLTMKGNAEDQTSLQRMLSDKYTMLDLYEPFPSKVWWQIFFDEGSINTKELEQSVLTSKYFQDENTPHWVRLWHFRNLADEEFGCVLKEVESEYSDRKFLDPQVIQHVTGIFLTLSDIGLYFKDKRDILYDSKLYINQMKENDQLEPLPQYVPLSEAIGYMSGSYRGLGFYGKELQEFKEFSSYLDTTRESVRIERMPSAGQDLLAIMQNDVWKFHSIICLSGSENQDATQKYYETPIFKYIEPTDFMEKILLAKHEAQRLIFWSLAERYKYDSTNEKLIEELEWLKSIRSLLYKEVSLKGNRVSGYNLKSLIGEYLDKIIEKLQVKRV